MIICILIFTSDTMCVQVLPKSELLFQGVEDIFLQDIEEEPEDYIEEYVEEYVEEKNNEILSVFDFIMLLLKI